MNNQILRAALAGATVTAFAAASIVPAAAESEGGWKGKGMRGGMDIEFSSLDADGDGQLTQEELASAKSMMVAELDADGDGMVSEEELAAAIEARISERAASFAARMIEKMDEDGDGMVSVDEFGGHGDPDKLFSRLDRDEDGMISEDEFNRMHMRGKHGHRKWHGGKGKGHDRYGGHKRGDEQDEN